MRQVNTRGGVFGSGGYGGGLFDGSNNGFGGLGGVGSLQEGAASGLGAIDLKTTDGYKACYGKLIQKCGEQYYQNVANIDAAMKAAATAGDEAALKSLVQAKSAQKALQAACIQTAESICLLQAGAAAATKLTTAQVAALQAKINAFLAQYGYCTIDVDGGLGGETCGAAVVAVSNGAAISVPGECAGVANTFKLTDCSVAGGGSGSSSGGGGSSLPITPTPITPPPVIKKPGGISAAWIVGGLLGAAVLTGVAVAVSKKKKH